MAAPRASRGAGRAFGFDGVCGKERLKTIRRGLWWRGFGVTYHSRFPPLAIYNLASLGAVKLPSRRPSLNDIHRPRR
jgi:hypothetical protein